MKYYLEAEELLFFFLFVLSLSLSLYRNPSLTIKTNTYHFCKLSLVKNPSACAPQAEGLKYYHEREVRETADSESLEDSGGKAGGSLPECSHTVTGFVQIDEFVHLLYTFFPSCQDSSKTHSLINVLELKFGSRYLYSRFNITLVWI